ncbi:MAG: hypothetical protein QOG10_2674 [Kribbellaceae bacterium]|jgi:hypothetical protein|nr:hypothetical protein [Kribbellaceae bacterium]
MSPEEAVEVLTQTLAELHVHTLPTTADDHGTDLTLDLGGRQVRLEVKYYVLTDRSRAPRVQELLEPPVIIGGLAVMSRLGTPIA